MEQYAQLERNVPWVNANMFCPKCGAQNADGTRFCRGCGADVSSLPTALTGKRPGDLALAEKQIDLYGAGLRGALIGTGFLISSGIAFAVSTRSAVLALFFLAFASYFLGTGIAKLLQSRALKRLMEPRDVAPAQLAPEQTEYLKPAGSIYETDNLTQLPSSITERTTTHLEMKAEKR